MKWISLVSLLALVVGQARAEFALKDGDTVVFLGDSITAARGYSKIIENYSILRFPERRIHFINAGVGGDTAYGSLQRLERDVFSKKATVLTVAFGINDIKWGVAADEEHRQLYLAGIRRIVEESQKRHIRVFICSPAITNEDPNKAEVGYLQRMVDDGLALARFLGAETIDVQRGMRTIQRRVLAANENDPKNKTTLHVSDGVHLNDLGQLAMGFTILKGLGAPAEVSNVSIDAASGQLLDATHCKVEHIKSLHNRELTFTRTDKGLPLSLGILGALNYRFIPIPDELNQYGLTIKNLPAGNYTIAAESRSLGKISAEELQKGLNIASMTTNGWEPGGPWDVQANTLIELTDSRDKEWQSGVVRSRFLPQHPDNQSILRKTRKLDDELTNLQRAISKPYPYHFQIKKVD